MHAKTIDNQQPSIIRSLTFFLSIFFFVCGHLAYSQSPFKTWAILCDAAAQNSGVPDLLTAQLTTEDFTLVERDALKRVVDERSLQQLIANTNGGKAALEIGSRLNADAIIVLSVVDEPTIRKAEIKEKQIPERNPPQPIPGQQPTPKILRISIYACYQGVRIGLMQMEQSQGAKRIDEIVEEIKNVRKRFQGGVRYAIGIPPFAIKNIEKDYDALGKKYHDLLSSRLASEPGVAILDVQNAQAISGEFPDESQIRGRIIPLIIEMDCTFRKDRNSIQPLITFDVRKVLESTAQEFHPGEMSLEKASEWIISKLPNLVIEKQTNNQVTPDKQKEYLLQRADFLAELGDFPNSIECREAFLLLEPNNVAQQLKIINEYRYLSALYATPLTRITRYTDIALDIRKNAFEHIESLILKKSIDQETAFPQLTYWLQFPHGTANIKPYVSIVHQDRAEARIAEDRERLLKLFPAYFKLSRTKELNAVQKTMHIHQWSNLVWQTLQRHVNPEHPPLKAMRQIFEAAADILPQDYPTSSFGCTFAQLLPKHVRFSELVQGTRITTEYILEENELQEFFQQLSNSDHIHLRIYGEFGLFNMKINKQIGIIEGLSINPKATDGLDKPSIQSWIPEAKNKIDTISKRPLANEIRLNVQSRYYDELLNCYQYRLSVLERGLKGVKTPEPSAPPMQETSLGRLEYEPLPIDLSAFASQEFTYVPAGPKFDLLIGRRSIVRVDRDFGSRVIHEYPKYVLKKAIWDGANIYVLDPDVNAPWVILDENGKVRCSINPQEAFPKYETLDVFPVAPNRLLVIGRLEKDSRSWCAMADLQGDKFKLTVFHEGRRSVEPFSPGLLAEELADTDWVVRPRWLGKYQYKGKEYLLLQRSVGNHLRIELPDLKVSSLLLPNMNFYGPPVCANDHLVFALNDAWKYDLNTPEKKIIEGKRIIPWNASEYEKGIWPAGNNHGEIFEYQGWIYLPGYAWHRISPTLDKFERLVPTRLPHEYAQLQFCKSENFGMLGVHSNQDGNTNPNQLPRIYQIRVRDNK